MSPRPRLSLCIPTFNRAAYLKGALESGLSEVASLPSGTVEILVCDNASTDETSKLILEVQTTHSELRAFRNDENIGFDLNYLRCVEEARGEFVWVMGDDDVWQPGSVARVLRELDAGADACLCLANACDSDLKPGIVLNWYKDLSPQTVWHLDQREDLIRYFNGCSYNAGAFAFISVSILPRDRLLLNREQLQQAVGTQYVHLYGMMALIIKNLNLHFIPEVLVLNRISNGMTNLGTDLFNRWMCDFRAWAHVADAVFGDDPELHASFSGIVRRNHGDDSLLPKLRQSAPTHEEWRDAIPFLVHAGFSSTAIAAVDFGFRSETINPAPPLVQEQNIHSLKILQFLAKEANRIAIVALGGLQNIIAEAALLATFRNKRADCQLRLFCTPECLEVLDGFEVQCLDPNRYARDVPYQESMAKIILDFAPELVVNLDPSRGLEADDLVAAAHAVSALAYVLPDQNQVADFINARNYSYTCLAPRTAGSEPLLEALGLEPAPASLWPSRAAREEAQEILAKLGWDPTKTVILLVAHPSIFNDPRFLSDLTEAAEGTWTFVGLGGKGVSYENMETLLRPLEGRSVNLTGALGLGETAALLQRCGGFLGGTPLLQTLAKACGASPPLRAITASPTSPEDR